MSTKHLVYLALVAIVLIINAILILYTMSRPFIEHFTHPDSEKSPDNDGLKSYVFKAFDARHHRNPTPEELEKYMQLNDKDAIDQLMDEESKPKSETKVKPVVIDETTIVKEEDSSSKKEKGIFNKALSETLQLIDTASNKPKEQHVDPTPVSSDGSDVTFSKTFIQTKIGNIQRQLDDLKRLL